MRRSQRNIFGVATVLCAAALVTAPALAAPEFHASEVGKEFTETEPGKEKGGNPPGAIQDFKFGAFHIQCEFVKTKGLVGFTNSKSLFVSATYKHCFALAKLGTQTIKLTAKFAKPVDFEYHANGFAETGAESESELKIVHPGSVTMSVPSLKCVIEWPAQTVPLKATKKPEGEFSDVLYGNEEVPASGKHFPSGFQKQLLITNNLKGMEYELSEGQCESFKKTEGKSSSYKGQLKDSVRNGNLSIG
jgi:hypothetical protein